MNTNKQMVIGFGLLGTAVVLAGVLLAAGGGVAEALFGKAVWYLPYAAAVAGIWRLNRVGGRRPFHRRGQSL